jgi:hypothetical protein
MKIQRSKFKDQNDNAKKIKMLIFLHFKLSFFTFIFKF